MKGSEFIDGRRAVSGQFDWNPIFDRRLGPRRSDEDRFISHVIFGVLAFSVFYFGLGVIKALIS